MPNAPRSSQSLHPADAPWPVVPLPGLMPDSLGGYLASLGLLAVATRVWPAVRACWHGGQFTLVRGPRDQEELVGVIAEVGNQGTWRPFTETWKKEKELFAKLQAAKKPDSTAPLLDWRAQMADEDELALFQAHLAVARSARANPLLRNPGGRRSFHSGWQDATRQLASPPKKIKPKLLVDDLSNYLSGEGTPGFVDSWNAGSWFAEANKIYNGTARAAFRNGKITPWAMALCCEAFPLFAGQSSRRLASRAASLAAFPFLSEASAPREEGACGQIEAEFWAPVWTRPMTWAEVTALFARGRAEVGGRGAVTPAALSAAVIQRGVDAGIAEFRRFTLEHTTSPKTFESRLADIIPVARRTDEALSAAVGCALNLRDRLPADHRKGTRWVYQGLRGPLDAALLDLAAARSPETARALVDEMFAVLARVDRNRTFREKKLRFDALPAAWAPQLFDAAGAVPSEARLALALASLVGTSDGSCLPWLAYRLGVEPAGRRVWGVPESTPFRRVWGGADLTADLAAVLRRRLVDIKTTDPANVPPPCDARLRVGLADVAAFLVGGVDEAALGRWLDRFGLFDWSAPGAELRRLLPSSARIVSAPDGPLLLHAFFRPLFDPSCLGLILEDAPPVRIGNLRGIAALLDGSDLPRAVAAARRAYQGLRVPLANFDLAAFHFAEPRRLLAALLIPASARQTANVFRRRWQMPLSKTTDPQSANL